MEVEEEDEQRHQVGGRWCAFEAAVFEVADEATRRFVGLKMNHERHEEARNQRMKRRVSRW